MHGQKLFIRLETGFIRAAHPSRILIRMDAILRFAFESE